MKQIFFSSMSKETRTGEEKMWKFCQQLENEEAINRRKKFKRTSCDDDDDDFIDKQIIAVWLA